MGIKILVNRDTSPINMFRILLTDEILDLIVSSTNEYGEALSLTNRPLTKHSRRQVFRTTNREEIMQFLGLCLLNGQIKSPNMRKMFTQSNSLYFHPIFTYIMSGRRFEQLLRCLSVSPQGASKLDKIKPLLNSLMRIFQAIYSPNEELSGRISVTFSRKTTL